MSADLDVLILAAGRGTRMNSDRPKVLHELLGEPLICHVIDAAHALKPARIGVIVGFGREDVRRALRDEKNLEFVVQKEQRGTGDAVRAAARRFKGGARHVLILSGDVPLVRPETLKDLVAEHRRRRAVLTLLTADVEAPGSLGRIVRSAAGTVERIVEFKDAGPAERAITEINAGVYVAAKDALFAALARVKPSPATGELYLTDAVGLIAARESRIAARVAGDFDEVRGINTLDELDAAQEVLRRRIVAGHRAHGVIIPMPDLSVIFRQVRIGPGTVIQPFSVIEGAVSIGARCTIGPFAHLRPGTILGDDCRVGNFVEVKQSTLGARTAARHLAFIGDAKLGADVNFGAGAITANFDGARHFASIVGDGASIGSGVVIVAPSKVGKGAVVGAGAVVTRGRPVAAGDVVIGIPARSRKRGAGRGGRKSAPLRQRTRRREG